MNDDSIKDLLGIKSIKIRIEYNKLRARDLADFYDLLDRVYRTHIRLVISSRFEYDRSGTIVIHTPDLEVKEVHTGNSIDSIVTAAPIAIPQWAAVLALTAFSFRYALDGVDKLLDVIIKIRKLLGDSKESEKPSALEEEILAETKKNQAEIVAYQKRLEVTKISVIEPPLN